MAAKRNVVVSKAKEVPKAPVRGKVAAPIADKTACRPSEATAIGGLTVGETKKKDVVDLTKEDANAAKMTADSREVTFNKLQGKTFPSLVVVARPTLKAKETNINDRPALDAKVKSVLMHSATKYTEWLIQQGLVRSEQSCQLHSKANLKLGEWTTGHGHTYGDAARFLQSILSYFFMNEQACTRMRPSSRTRAAMCGSATVAHPDLCQCSVAHCLKVWNRSPFGDT